MGHSRVVFKCLSLSWIEPNNCFLIKKTAYPKSWI